MDGLGVDDLIGGDIVVLDLQSQSTFRTLSLDYNLRVFKYPAHEGGFRLLPV